MKNEILEALTIIEEEHNRTKRDIEIIKQAKQEISRLNNIIEEVRKCLNKNRIYIHGERNLSFEIEQILNKENNYENKDALYKIDDAIRKENIKLKVEILQNNQEIERLNNKIQDLQADYGNIAQVERDFLKEENKRLNNIIDKALHKLRASKDHFKTENENNAVSFTIKILEERDKG